MGRRTGTSIVLKQVGSSDIMQTTNRYRVAYTIGRSWVCFTACFVAMIAVGLGSYAVIAAYAPGALKYFFWGGGAALLVGGLSFVFNEPLVRLIMGAERVRERSDCPRLWDAVHRVTPFIAKPVPRIYFIPYSGMNACAFGWGLPYFSAVAATKGLVEKLNDDELAAVMAHEVGHIANKDILVSTVMSVLVIMTAFTGWFLWRLGPFTSDNRSNRSREGGGAGAAIVAIVVGLGLYTIGRLFGYLLQLFVSRQREYAADATSAAIMGSPQPLITALHKIVQSPSIIPGPRAQLVGFLCTADPDPADMFSTHPEFNKRIAALRALAS